MPKGLMLCNQVFVSARRKTKTKTMSNPLKICKNKTLSRGFSRRWKPLIANIFPVFRNKHVPRPLYPPPAAVSWSRRCQKWSRGTRRSWRRWSRRREACRTWWGARAGSSGSWKPSWAARQETAQPCRDNSRRWWTRSITCSTSAPRTEVDSRIEGFRTSESGTTADGVCCPEFLYICVIWQRANWNHFKRGGQSLLLAQPGLTFSGKSKSID